MDEAIAVLRAKLNQAELQAQAKPLPEKNSKMLGRKGSAPQRARSKKAVAKSKNAQSQRSTAMLVNSDSDDQPASKSNRVVPQRNVGRSYGRRSKIARSRQKWQPKRSTTAYRGRGLEEDEVLASVRLFIHCEFEFDRQHMTDLTMAYR